MGERAVIDSSTGEAVRDEAALKNTSFLSQRILKPLSILLEKVAHSKTTHIEMSTFFETNSLRSSSRRTGLKLKSHAQGQIL